MPIKFPNTEFRVPIELAQFREFLQSAIDHEAEVNPDISEYYAYFTVDQRFVKAGTTHRRGGIHIDGVQGARYPTKLPPEHIYSASNTLGTVFYNQAFDLTDLDPTRHHVHTALERQARMESKFISEDFGIYFWDSYSVHETGVAPTDVVRTFVRLEFGKKVYDALGDTISPLFNYHWIQTDRSIPLDLESLDPRK